MAKITHPLSLARKKYARHKAQSKFRNIGFNFSFDDWYQWWLSNGIDKNQKDKWDPFNRPCMCRYNDSGPYEISNVYFSNNVENTRDRFKKSFMYRWKDDVLPRHEFMKKYNIERHYLKKYLDKDYFKNLDEETKTLTLRYNKKFKDKIYFEYDGQKYTCVALSKKLSVSRPTVNNRSKNPDKFGIKKIIIKPNLSLEDYIKQNSIYPR